MRQNADQDRMKQSYPDICLERAEKATEGPWKLNWGNSCITDSTNSESIIFDENCRKPDAEFIAAARTDVPELVRRLKKACVMLNQIGIPTDELEAPLEKK
jgi:hypothetical protein